MALRRPLQCRGSNTVMDDRDVSGLGSTYGCLNEHAQRVCQLDQHWGPSRFEIWAELWPLMLRLRRGRLPSDIPKWRKWLQECNDGKVVFGLAASRGETPKRGQEETTTRRRRRSPWCVACPGKALAFFYVQRALMADSVSISVKLLCNWSDRQTARFIRVLFNLVVVTL